MSDTTILLRPTERGFLRGEFRDLNGDRCSIQKSSAGSQPALWLGCDEGLDVNDRPPWPGKKRELLARMHLSQDMVKALLPLLQHFAETGELPRGNGG